nr:MAG TPA: tail length tape measure protein [Caudoviricetes sp.]
MAASIAYKINGSFDSKPLDQAQKGIEKLSKAAGAMKLAIGGFVVGAALKGLKSVIDGSSIAFVNQNKALTVANKAFLNNNKLSADSINNIKSAMNGFSLNNFIDGDTLNNAAALASNMGLNEKQIVKVLDAARELSAATGQDLNSCVKQLSQSYDGNVASLKKLVPEIGNLTEEEIKNGKAVDLIKEKYNGFSESMSKTFEGRSKQFANTFSDLQASIGGVFQGLKFMSEGALMEPMKKLTSFIEEHRNQIINFFLNLPEIAGVAMTTLKDVIIRTMDNLPSLGSFLVGTIVNWLPVVGEFFKACGEILIGIFDVSFGNLGRLFYNKVIISIKESLQNLINDFVKEHPKIADWVGLDQIKLDLTPKAYSTFGTYVDAAKKNVEQAKQNAQDAIKKQAELNSNFASKYSDITSKAHEKLKTILNKDLPKDLKAAFDAGSEKIAENISGITSNSTSVSTAKTNVSVDTTKIESGAKKLTDALNKLGGAFNFAGSIISAFTDKASAMETAKSTFLNATQGIQKGTKEMAAAQQGLAVATQAADAAFKASIIGLIIALVVKLCSALREVSPAMNDLMNGIDIIMKTIAEIIGPIIENILKPFADGLRPIGQIIGQILIPALAVFNELFTPLNTALTEILNIIAPIITALQPAITAISKLLAMLTPMNIVLKLLAAVLKIFGDAIMFIYNKILVPVVNFLLKIICAVGNFFIRMYNGIIGVLNSISIFGWHPFNFSTKSEMNYDSMKLSQSPNNSSENGNGRRSGNTNTGGSASYTAAKDIYVNIYYNHSYVNGDARQIALSIRDEIKSAERLGY